MISLRNSGMDEWLNDFCDQLIRITLKTYKREFPYFCYKLIFLNGFLIVLIIKLLHHVFFNSL